MNIIKKISASTLRNSFATHLLEDSVSLRYVQVLLECNSSKTIGIYTHVANTNMNFIKNPLD
ncbi:tyrosine-type recombinase/integrase [Fulvivirgaceae bacterium BMA12]|uniref:Tyrosine-type recombinase/integrase n=1 Tax=Agaribacillus aureus TaxID=3051825 RepID=A0ABT8LGC8_9BACT|nr:tyrosine-type recombinase/integrase [Fulvivirgaceae bacterium BMA12]